MSEVAGTYVASRNGGTTHGVLTSTTGAQTTDHLAAGATITLQLHADGTTTGHAFIPDPQEPLDADLTGTWSLSGSTVHLSHAEDTFLRDITFDATGDALVAEATFVGTRVTVRLDKTT